MAKSKLKPHETVFLCIFALMLFVAYDLLWKNSHKKELESLNLQLSQATTAAQNDELLLKKFSPTVSRGPASSTLGASKDLLEKYSKSNDRFSKVMMQLSDEAGTPFTLTRFSTEKQSKVGPYTKTPINLEAQATFLTIGHFLETLDDSPLLTEVESIEISRLDNDLKLCNAKIHLYSYVTEP